MLPKILIRNPPLTGTGTLIISLVDVNDNAPRLLENYHPIIEENLPPGQKVIEVMASDEDTISNGAPFEFWVPCRGSCPCQDNPSCDAFEFVFVPDGGPIRHGSGIVSSLKTFDRETQKSFLLPIIIRDSGNPPMSATNMLTITVGDVNDNKHHSAHKDVMVYQIQGFSTDSPLGRVYAEDEDDWDTPNKTFTFETNEHHKHFRLDTRTGQLFQKQPLPQGTFELSVRVFDSHWRREVISTVDVHVTHVTPEAISSTASVRFENLTPEEFLSTSTSSPDRKSARKEEFVKLLAQTLNVPTNNVLLISISKHSSSSSSSSSSSLSSSIHKYQNFNHHHYHRATNTHASQSSSSTSLDVLFSVFYSKLSQTNRQNYQESRNNDDDDGGDDFDGESDDDDDDDSDYGDGDYDNDLGSTNRVTFIRPAKLTAVINSNIAAFSSAVGSKITESPIECCSEDSCLEPRRRKTHLGDTCRTRLVVKESSTVVDSNATSWVGPKILLEATCHHWKSGKRKSPLLSSASSPLYPPFNPSSSSSPSSSSPSSSPSCKTFTCLNGGVCMQDGHSKMLCVCPSKFKGPRCQQTEVFFRGRGWASYPSVPACMSCHFSLEFNTRQGNSLVLYQGPMFDASSEASDFLSVELKNGHPLVRVNLGSGEGRIYLGLNEGSTDARGLSDGQWHRLDIFIDNKTVQVIVDNCHLSSPIHSSSSSSSLSWSSSSFHHSSSNLDSYLETINAPCKTRIEVPGSLKFLDTRNGLLYLGGRSKFKVKQATALGRDGFHGCIRNFRFNGELMDLHTRDHKNTENTCPGDKESCIEVQCKNNGVTRCRNFVFGQAINRSGSSKCICQPGWTGDECQLPSPVMDMKTDSFVSWEFHQTDHSFPSTHSYNHHHHLIETILNSRGYALQVMFRTRTLHGVILELKTSLPDKVITLEIIHGHLHLSVLNGEISVDSHLSLSHLNVSDGNWHSTSVLVTVEWMSIELDGGEMDSYNESLLPLKARGAYRHDPRVMKLVLTAGSKVKVANVQETPIFITESSLGDGCISDVRINSFHLPSESLYPGNLPFSSVLGDQNRHHHQSQQQHGIPFHQQEQQLLLLRNFRDNHLPDEIVHEQKQTSPLNFVLRFRGQNIGDGCPSDECSDPLKPPCPYGLLCVDLWRHSICQCPPGKRLIQPPSSTQLSLSSPPSSSSLSSSSSFDVPSNVVPPLPPPHDSSLDVCVNLNECLESPCHHGECHDEDEGFYCVCVEGWEGEDCTRRSRDSGIFNVVTKTATVIALASGALVIVLIIIVLLAGQKKKPESYLFVVNPDEDFRDGALQYNEEGLGEEDQTGYDINKLKKPLDEKHVTSGELKEKRVETCQREDLDNLMNCQTKCDGSPPPGDHSRKREPHRSPAAPTPRLAGCSADDEDSAHCGGIASRTHTGTPAGLRCSELQQLEVDLLKSHSLVSSTNCYRRDSCNACHQLNVTGDKPLQQRHATADAAAESAKADVGLSCLSSRSANSGVSKTKNNNNNNSNNNKLNFVYNNSSNSLNFKNKVTTRPICTEI